MAYRNYKDTKASVPDTVAYTRPPKNQISYEDFLEQNPKTGFLKIQASWAQQAVPISGLWIHVAQEFMGERVLFFEGKTDPNGIIDGIVLPAPPKAESFDPKAPHPGAIYQVYASREGLSPQRYEVEIFEDITTILPVTLGIAKEE